MISETPEISETTEVEEPLAEASEAPEAEEAAAGDAEDEAVAPVAEAAADASEDDAEEDEEDDEDAPEDDAESDEPAAEAGKAEPGTSDFDNLRLVEALLFASAEPLAPAQLARFLPEETEIDPLLADLEALYANRGVNLVKRGGRWAFRTAADLAPRMELENKVVRKLSRVALETLAVIAYHQPVTRAEIEEIRGVALSKGTLDSLLEIGWIRPKGRRRTPGRPVTWATSDSFLDHFGLEGLDALPGVEELKAAGLLDTRPALTALSDRGLLPSAGEVAPEDVDEEDDEDENEGSERELLDETFGEDLLPREVETKAAEPGDAESETQASNDDAENDDGENDGGEAAVGADDHAEAAPVAQPDDDDDGTAQDDETPKRSLG